MFKKIKLFTPIICVLMLLCAVLVVLTLFFDRTLFLISASVTLVTFAVLLVLFRRVSNRSGVILREISDGIAQTGESGFVNAPMPVITVYEGSEIIWYNEACARSLFVEADVRGMSIAEILPGLDVSGQSPPEGYGVVCRGRMYTAHVAVTRRNGSQISIVYLIDDSDLKQIVQEYYLSRPSVVVIMVDNYEELIQDYRESERAQLMTEIEAEIEKYILENHGFTVRSERDRFLAVIEDRGLRSMITGKFDILDRIRAIQIGGRMSATLSIGVGREAATLHESEMISRQALDMCLGRGGDQAAVRTQNGYEFFGGVSRGVEKRTKVKTRIIASALNELLESSGNVIIMGHRFADLDALGSAVGMLKAVHSMDIPAVICINRQKNLVGPLLEKLEAGGYGEEEFVGPDEALEMVRPDTLLIVVDTHVPQVLESEELYRACKNVVVIDHHRKLVSYIDNAVIFYHEPFASSASEMVAELIQYFPSRPHLTKLEADALLSGIMLDTKNFILRTGVRTFEAAAWLRRMGADTVEVRKLFASSMETYQQKTALVANAVIYRGCAIAASDAEFEGIKVVAPQAADELITISGVDASFLIFQYEDVINVSARSMGEINVQIIMEKLGGGGHLTMAAAQFPGANMEDIRERVVAAIDDYYASLNTVQEA